MRQRQGIAGATLIYGPQPEPPDLLLASQFLIDDLRRDGRAISGVRVSRHTLRLRADGFELALSLTDTPLPVHAFAGVARPRSDAAGAPDLMRGRVLHALRHHRWVLGVLLRLRGVQEGQSMALRLRALPGTCHALTGAVVEAAPPMLVIWQANGLLCTASEFLRLSGDILERPADGCSPIGPLRAGRAPLARPDAHGPTVPTRVTPRQAIAAAAAPKPGKPGATVQDPDPPDDNPPDATPPAAAVLIAQAESLTPSAGAKPALRGLHRAPPTSRAERAQRQSGGRLFGRRPQQGRVPRAAAPGLARHDVQLADALRHHPRVPAQEQGEGPTSGRLATTLRIGCICLGLALLGAPASNTDPPGIAARGAAPETVASQAVLLAP